MVGTAIISMFFQAQQDTLSLKASVNNLLTESFGIQIGRESAQLVNVVVLMISFAKLIVMSSGASNTILINSKRH